VLNCAEEGRARSKFPGVAHVIETQLSSLDQLPARRRFEPWFVLGVLMLVTLLSQLDRQLPSLLVKPIRQAFIINDAQFSLIQGYAFAISYTVAGLLCGSLVDRYNRRNLIILGLALWSSMTVLAGFTESYAELLATRVGVGLGEACLAPAAYSIIADYFIPRLQGRALGIYYGSLALGSGLSLLLGGALLSMLPNKTAILVPHLGSFAPWQLMFVAAGLPGAVLVLLMLMVREPPRSTHANVAAFNHFEHGLRPFVVYLKRHRSAFLHIFASQGLIAYVGYGELIWAPTLYNRRFGMPIATAGVTLGLIAAAIGFLGTTAGGLISDRWFAAGRKSARYAVLTVSWAPFVIFFPLWALAQHLWVSLACFAVLDFFSALGAAVGPPGVQAMVPNRMRGKAVAVYLMIFGIFGIGLGPTAVALATDYIFANDQALGYALVTMLYPAILLGLLLSLTGRAAYERTCHQLVKPHRIR
jgi:MFS family permease